MGWVFAIFNTISGHPATRRLGLWLALIVAVAFAAWLALQRAEARGYASGQADCEAAHAEAAHKLNLALSAAQDRATSDTIDFEIQRQELAALKGRLADAALSDPASGGACIGADGVHRLNAIR